MTLQNPNKHSLQIILEKLQEGFNRYLNQQGLSNHYDIFIDEHNHIIFTRNPGGTTALWIAKRGDTELEIVTFVNDLQTHIKPQLKIYIEALEIR